MRKSTYNKNKNTGRIKQLAVLAIIGILAIVTAVVCIFTPKESNNITVEYDKQLVKTIEKMGNTNLEDIEGFNDGRYRLNGRYDILEVIKEGNSLTVTYEGTGKYNGIFELLCKAEKTKQYKEATLYDITGVTVVGDGTLEPYLIHKDLGNTDNLIERIKSGMILSEQVHIAPMHFSVKIINDGRVIIDDNEYTYMKLPTLEEVQKSREEAEKTEQYNGVAGTYVDENGVTHYTGGVVIDENIEYISGENSAEEVDNAVTDNEVDSEVVSE